MLKRVQNVHCGLYRIILDTCSPQVPLALNLCKLTNTLITSVWLKFLKNAPGRFRNWDPQSWGKQTRTQREVPLTAKTQLTYVTQWHAGDWRQSMENGVLGERTEEGGPSRYLGAGQSDSQKRTWQPCCWSGRLTASYWRALQITSRVHRPWVEAPNIMSDQI